MTAPLKTTLFVGPTLAHARVRARIDELPAGHALARCELRPPVGQGDVLRAMIGGARRIGIIDGYFDRVPSVWHKEILFALERGVAVYGAASMGALRAAELHSFGMIGVGRIFEMYRAGELEDDDEVTIVHDSAEGDYRPLSEAMVNIRHRVAAAVDAGLLDASAAARAIDAVKALPYRQRTIRALIGALDAPGDDARAFLLADAVSLKQQDALALVDRMAAGADVAPARVTVVERTVFLERLRLQVLDEARRAQSARAAGADAADDDASARALARRRRALLGLLAEQRADMLGLVIDDDELDDARASLGPSAPRDGVLLERRARVAAKMRRLERRYRAELEQRLLHDVDG